jgi:hypothetical protein
MESFYYYVDLLNKELKDSLKFYTSPEYKEMNEKVRGNVILNKDIRNHYNNILDSFDGAPTVKTSFVVYRGMTKRYNKTEGFISTSLNKDVAKTFHKGSSCCLYIITLTPGEYGILPLAHVSEMPEEEEVLLPPGSLSIQSVVPYSESKENVDVIYCTYIPENAVMINAFDLNELNNKKFNQTKIDLSTESWVNRILDSNIKEEIELLCDDSEELDKCIYSQLETLDFYEDIPIEAISKFILLFKNLSENIIKNI